jgi:tetratricopeptide (TPR) repeat protein/CelD/BcsL family acetyltransferase involved in cellulose biosynthesis
MLLAATTVWVGSNAMHIDVITGYEAFVRLQTNWDAVYDADPESQFFLSWTWLSKYLSDDETLWFILGAKTDVSSPNYVAFFPLRLQVGMRKSGVFYNEITMAGRNFADYSGLICEGRHAAAAIAAFAGHLRRRNWAVIKFEYFRASDERTRLLKDHFPDREFDTTEVAAYSRLDDVDNCICPYVKLPRDWGTYLNDNLSTNMRQKIRRLLRQVEGSPDFRITHAQADTVERDLKLLLGFWETKWRPRKGSRIPDLLRTNYAMLRRCFESGALFLPVLWRGDRPLGALASFLDVRKKSLLFFITGRDETFNNPSPGLVLHAHSIRHAIENGIATYDFLRGNESYKYSFGPEEFRLRCILVTTRSRRNIGKTLEPGTLPLVLRRTAELHKDGRIAEAERGYRQVLDVESQNPGALYGLGQVMAARANHRAAERYYKAVLAAKPNFDHARFSLARSLEAQGKRSAAVELYRDVLVRRPADAVAHNKVGHAFFKLGYVDAAIAAFETAHRLKPGDAEAELSWANALQAAGRLSAAQRAHFATRNIELGDRKRQGGAIALAIGCYRQAIGMKSDLAAAYFGLGLAYEASRNVEGAVRSYRRLLEIEPAHGEARAHLAALATQQDATPLQRSGFAEACLGAV